MAKILKRILIYILVSYFVLTMFKGIELPTSYLYLFASFFGFTLAIFLSSALLSFLTIKENFITNFVMSTLLCIGVFFLLDTFMPGFSIKVYRFEGLDTGNLVINSFDVTKTITMIAVSVVYSIFTSILNVLEKNT